MEIWKDIKGFEGLYQASNLGFIRNKNNKLLKDRFRGGYKSAVLYKNNLAKTYSVHRLIAITFIENKNQLDCVNHIDGNKYNNNLTNLEWVSIRENLTYRYKNRTLPTGVSKVKKCNKFTAQIYVNKTKLYLGNFDTIEDANKVYLQAVKFYKIENKYL